MPNPLRLVALFALALPTFSSAQPTLERTSCLHPVDQDRAGISLALATADWDDDGRDDLMLGLPYWDFELQNETQNGHFASFHWDPVEPSDWGQLGGNTDDEGSQMGRALAAGDFDGDALPELAIGIPFVGGGKVVVFEPAGEICCIHAGIDLVQGMNGISDSAEPGDAFGRSLAAGDFDGDGYDDLAVGVMGESWAGVGGVEQGAVHVFYGTPDGLDGARDLLFGQHAINQTREDLDHFGWALVAGDLDGDGYADLAIGVPDENEGALSDSGIVHVVFGSSAGLDLDRYQNWTQSSSGITTSPAAGERFGASLAIGDFDRATIAPIRRELAISVPGEDDGALADAGAVHVLYSGAGGPTSTAAQFFRRPGGSLSGAAFGSHLLAADLDHDKVDDLVIGSSEATYATPPGFPADGDLHLYFGLYGGALRFSGLAPWRGTAGSCFAAGQANEQFGTALAAGDFDDDGRTDLAVGIPGWSASPGNIFEGAVEILFGASGFRDGFETGDISRWSNAP